MSDMDPTLSDDRIDGARPAGTDALSDFIQGGGLGDREEGDPALLAERRAFHIAHPTETFLARLEDIGVTHLATKPWAFYGGEETDLHAKIEAVKRFADEQIR